MYLYVSRSSAQISQADEFMQSKPDYNNKRYEETAPVHSGGVSSVWFVAEAEEIWDDELGWQGAPSPICRLELLPKEDAFGIIPIGSQACRLELLGKDTDASSDAVPHYWQSRTRVEGANSTDPAEWSQWGDERDMLVSSSSEPEQLTLGIVPLPLVSGLNDAALQRSPVDRAIYRFVKARVPTMMHEVANLRIHAEGNEVQGWCDEIQRHSNTLNAVLFEGLVAAWEAAMSASVAAQAALDAAEARRKRGVSGDSSNTGSHIVDVKPPRGVLRLIDTCKKLEKLDLTDCRLVTPEAIKQLEDSNLEVTRIQDATKLNAVRFLRFVEGDLSSVTDPDGTWGKIRRSARQEADALKEHTDANGEFEADHLESFGT
jgi:hypothetical protein